MTTPDQVGPPTARLQLPAVGGQGWREVFRVLALARLNYAASGG